MNQMWKRKWENKSKNQVLVRVKQEFNLEACFLNPRILLFLIIPFFKPVCIQYISYLGFLEKIMVIWKIAAAFLIGILLIRELYIHSTISSLVWAVSLFEVSIFFSTLFHLGYLQRALIDMVSMVAFVSLLFYGMKFNSKKFFSLLGWTLRILVLVDLCSMLVFPRGIPADLYTNGENPLFFMTIDNGSALFLLFCMMVFAIEIEMMTVRGQQRKIRLLFLLFCPICAVLSHSGTSLVVVGFFTVVLVLLHRFGDRIKFPWKMVCTVYGLLAAGVIIMPQNTIVRLIMTKIFHYSADLSGRALLWSGAIEKLKGHALLGYGRSVQDYIPAWGGFFSSHNFWLELLLQGGFVAVILFVVCVCICYQNSGKYLQTKQGKTAAFAFLVMMISAMMESAVHSVYLFGTMTFLYCSKWLVMGDDSNCRQIEEETDRKKKQTETALADLILPVEENTRQVSAKSDFFGPILSVIVPIYNGEHFLQQLISSIILQKMSGLELILVDDGSTDQTLTICREFEKSYEWIKVFHTENMGVSHARNVGLRHAKGKWIHFVDSDDHILPGMYTRFVQMAEHGIENPDVLVCGCIRITANNGEKTSCGPERTGIVTDVNIPKLFDHMSMERRYYLLDYIWNKWYRREVIERYRIRFPENLSLGEDFAFNAKYFQHAEKIVLISECYYQYQIQEDGLVSRFQEEPWKGRKILYREQNELYRKLGLLSENEKWIRQQAGQIAFGDIRMISSPRCSYKWKEKKKFVQKMIKSPQYGLILEYLKAKGETSILFRCYFYLFALRSAEITAGVICFEKKVRDFMRKAFHSIQKGRIGRAKEKS